MKCSEGFAKEVDIMCMMAVNLLNTVDREQPNNLPLRLIVRTISELIQGLFDCLESEK
jgi:hypothetical protein